MKTTTTTAPEEINSILVQAEIIKPEPSKQQLISEGLEYLPEELINVIYDLINLNSYVNKRDLVKFAAGPNNPNYKTFDTATPLPYMQRIFEIYPEATEGNYIYNYSDEKYGTLENINNAVVSRILKSLRR